MKDIEVGLGNPEFERVKRILDELRRPMIEKETLEAIRGLIHHPVTVEEMTTDEVDEMGSLFQMIMGELTRHKEEELADELVVKFHESNPAQKWYDVEVEKTVEEARDRTYHIPRLDRSLPEGAFLDAICYTVLPRLQELDRPEDLSIDTTFCDLVREYIVPWLKAVDPEVLNEAQISELKRVIPGIIEQLERLSPFIIHPDFVTELEVLLNSISE